MIDSALLGQTAARCMEEMDTAESLEGGEIIAVGIIVVANDSEGNRSVVRTYMSDSSYYRQLGILHAGLDCISTGYRFSPGGTDGE